MNFSSQSMDIEDDFSHNAVPSLTMWPTVDSTSFQARTLTFNNGPVFIGRTDGMFKIGDDSLPSGTNGIFVEGSVSRHHAKISFDNGRFLIQDMKSTHGTKVNGERLECVPHMLKNGDLVMFGKGGWHEGVQHKPVIGLVHLHYPTYDSLVPGSQDQNPGNHQVEVGHLSRKEEEAKVDCNFDKTASLEDLIKELEEDDSPRAKMKKQGLEEAIQLREALGISKNAAVSMVPKLTKF